MSPSAKNDISKSKLAFNNVHLYGRENYVARLKEAYRESSNTCQIVWLYGYAGVGKTTLVQIAFQGEEHYCHGKFDRLGSAQPYSAIATLLSRLCLILEFEFPAIQVSAEVAMILSKILPDAGQVLTYNKSDMVEVTEKQNASRGVVDKKLEWGFEKLKDAIQTFVKGACDVIGSVSMSRLILHLDDLQWADEDSIQIIQALLTGCDRSTKGLLFIGSYRDNELTEDSPLTLCKKSTK